MYFPEIQFFSYSTFLPLPDEVFNTWTKDQSNNDTTRQILDFQGDLNGHGYFTCANDDYFEGQFNGSVRDRYGHLTKPREAGRYTVGTWKNGLLDGVIDMEIERGWIRCAYKNGCKHGLERTYDGPYANAENLRRVALFKEDKVVGQVWQCLPGGAYMLGTIDPDTEEYDGKIVTYLFPDCKMAIIGRFTNGTFISGYMHTIDSIEIGHGIPTIHVCPEPLGSLIRRDFATNSIIGKYPLHPDLWESDLVEVKNSFCGPSAGQGLFLKRDVQKGQIVALFNGLRYLSSRNNCQDDTPDQNYDYRIRLNGDYDIDIPPQYTSLDNYCATLGHKANHSFSPNAK